MVHLYSKCTYFNLLDIIFYVFTLQNYTVKCIVSGRISSNNALNHKCLKVAQLIKRSADS